MEKNIEKNIEKDTEKKPCYITFSKKMIASIREHSNKTKIDKNTGEVMKIVAVKVPSKDYRNADMQFDADSNGIDRNERVATFNLVESYVKENRDENGKFLNHYAYLDENREYNINFRGQEVGMENGKKIYDKPEPIKLKGSQIASIFQDARIRSLNIKKEQMAEKKKEANEKGKEGQKKKKQVPKKEKKPEVER